jgi:hypothetical protein
MHFRVSEWISTQDYRAESIICPYRVLDPATGFRIAQVTEFDDDDGWLRVLCRAPKLYEGQTNFAYCDRDTDELVSQILYVPFQVVPYYEGIDDLPEIFIDTIDYNDGHPIGDWIPNERPYTHPSEGKA